MPIKIKRIADQDLTVFVVTGEVSLEELWQTVRSILRDNPTGRTLWDLREIKAIPGYTNNIESFLSYAKRHSAKRPPGKTAIVTSTIRDFGLTRMTETFSEILKIPWEIRSFSAMEEATEWLAANYR